MILGKSVKPCDGEQSVKSYHCTQFDSRLFGLTAQGYLEITNRRLLFQSRGTGLTSKSVLHSEIGIAEISGINVYYGSTFSLLVMVAGFVGSLLAIAAWNYLWAEVIGGRYFAYEHSGFLKFSSLVIFVLVMFYTYRKARRRAFSLLISSKGNSGTAVAILGLSPFGQGLSAASKALTALPGPDSDKLIEELGALISDIQTQGDYGIEKWKGGRGQ